MSQFLRIALGSLKETQDALIDARDQTYVSAEEFDEIWALSVTAIKTTEAFKRSIDDSPDPRSW